MPEYKFFGLVVILVMCVVAIAILTMQYWGSRGLRKK